MVSFSCESCNETIIKKKVAAHLGRCRAPVSCIDCSETFSGQTFKDHNQCMTENEKYQGKLYKPRPTPKPPIKGISVKKVPAKASKPRHVKIEKETTMKKLLKKLRKEHKLDKKTVLEKLTIDASGTLNLK